MQRCYLVVRDLMVHTHAIPFCFPVDPVVYPGMSRFFPFIFCFMIRCIAHLYPYSSLSLFVFFLSSLCIVLIIIKLTFASDFTSLYFLICIMCNYSSIFVFIILRFTFIIYQTNEQFAPNFEYLTQQ